FIDFIDFIDNTNFKKYDFQYDFFLIRNNYIL
ncbi:MAG: hypothetical protein PWP73_1031, partial [Methanococcus sp.]|nr:hypothetical protein [Methanococcus sp.]